MLTKQQMLTALDGLIDGAARLHTTFLQDFSPWSADFAAWLKASESTIEAIFGTHSDALSSFKNIRFTPVPGNNYTNELDEMKSTITWFDSGLRYAHATLIGYRYSVERLARDEPARATPYIFIAHGGPALTHVNLVRDFFAALGLQGVVIQDLPNLNMSLNEKVRFYMGLCAGGIALATRDDETLAHEQRTRPNVENEIGMMQTAPNISARIVYLKEQDVQFASNYAEKVWITFRKDQVQDAFIAIAKELRAFGFLS